MTQRACVGVFDSGIGGLSVWREIIRLMPSVPTLYLADQAHLPYGTRSPEEIQNLALGIARFLLSEGASLIVVACNTASGAALSYLRQALPDTPFVGMEPAIKPAVERTQTGHVGVLATPTTFRGELFQRLMTRFRHRVAIHTATCPGLVQRVEDGALEGTEALHHVEACLRPLLTYPIDQLVLGCTHYPFARTLIQKVVGSDVALIDPAPAVARQTKRLLLNYHPLISSSEAGPSYRFITTGQEGNLRATLESLLGLQVTVERATWRGGKLQFA